MKPGVAVECSFIERAAPLTGPMRLVPLNAVEISTQSPRIRLPIFQPGFSHFPLAFSFEQSDESSCAEPAQKRIPTQMTTAETNATDKAATVAAQGAHVAPEKAPASKAASQKTGAPKAKRAVKGAKQAARAKATPAKPAAPKQGATAGAKASKKPAKTAAAKKAAAPRAESKGAKILEMIARAKGATLAEIMKATDWQAHSVRGFISTATKKHGVKIESAKNEGGGRVYRIAK
jgi:Protein of unknown function (DUF3489)